MQAMSFHEVYRGLLLELMNHGVTEVNERTHTKIRMLQGGHSFKLDLSDGRLPVAGNRRYYPHIAAAETVWQFMGTKDPAFIVGKAPKLWSKFVETETVKEDRGNGPHNVERKVLKTAYGWRWRHEFGRDQLELAIHELKTNPTNRQLFISAWDPRSDGLGGVQPKNIPCPVGFTLSRFMNDLHMNVFIRSSDVFIGLPYDVMSYALTADAVAATIGLRPRTLHFTLAHAHLYEPHWTMTEACLTGTKPVYAGKARDGVDVSKASTIWADNVQPNLPGWDIQAILDNPDGYVAIVRTLAGRTSQNAWDPMPDVIE